MGISGLTRLWKSLRLPSGAIFTMAISTIRSCVTFKPVASRSKMARLFSSWMFMNQIYALHRPKKKSARTGFQNNGGALLSETNHALNSFLRIVIENWKSSYWTSKKEQCFFTRAYFSAIQHQRKQVRDRRNKKIR